MDEQWVCPKCGFGNQYYAGYCVSCNEVRPSDDAQPAHEAKLAHEPAPAHEDESAAAGALVSPPTAASAGSEPHVCAICERQPARFFSFRANVGMVVIQRVHAYEGWLCRTCATGKFREMQGRNLAWGWFGIISFIQTLGNASDNLKNYRKNRLGLDAPAPSDPERDKKLVGTPVILRALPGLGVVAAIVAIATVVLVGQAQDRADRPYIDDFIRVNDVRSRVVDLANSRSMEWTSISDEPIPPPDYLSADEIEGLRADVQRMTAPGSDELRQLHQAWLASVQKLAEAERLLATEPTEANLLADNQASSAEYGAYQALYDFCEAHD